MADIPFNTLGVPKIISDYDAELVQDVMREFAQLSIWRNNFAAQWEEVAQLVLPTSRNTFMYGNFNMPGEKKTQQQVDATGMMALSRFAAICDSLLTPRNMTWHTLEANDDYVMKDRATKLWFEAANRKLFKLRYNPMANFSSQNQNNFQSLGAFGTGGMFIDRFMGMHGERGLRYKAIPLGELFLRENHQGLVDGFIRWFRMTAQQIYQRWPNDFPEKLKPLLESKSQTPVNILHRVCPRNDYDAERLDYKGMPFSSCYICIESLSLLQEGGYNTLPIAASRYDQTPGEIYGRSPAMMVLPALKTLNAEKKTFLKQGHRAADPVLLTSDDGVVDMSLRPGAMNKGGVTNDGKLLVHALPTGNIQISKEMMQEEKQLINDAFLVTLFQILTEGPGMTATEVIERATEKGILLAPTIGRQQSEYLGPLIDREINLAAELGLLDEMPPRLKEARGSYDVVYTSPMSRQMRSQEAAGFWRTVDQATQVVNITQDPAILDVFDFQTALQKTADINGALPSYMASPEAMAAKAQNRAKQQQAEQAIQAAPAQAGMMKAQAAQKKAGMEVLGQQ